MIVHRRTGGLEMYHTDRRNSGYVDRRTGGLEKRQRHHRTRMAVDRRTGGLEMVQLTILLFFEELDDRTHWHKHSGPAVVVAQDLKPEFCVKILSRLIEAINNHGMSSHVGMDAPEMLQRFNQGDLAQTLPLDFCMHSKLGDQEDRNRVVRKFFGKFCRECLSFNLARSNRIKAANRVFAIR